MELDTSAAEITLDLGGISEHSYLPGLSGVSPTAIILTNELIREYPECILAPFPPLDDWELIGITHANGQNYFESTISVTVMGFPAAELLNHLNCPGEWHRRCLQPFYSLKFLLESRRIVVKVYDSEDHRHPTPSLPRGVTMAKEFGIGLHLNHPELAHFRDMYLYTHEDVSVLEQHFGMRVPCYHTAPGGRRVYGCLFDAQTLKVVKLKQYIYPSDVNAERV